MFKLAIPVLHADDARAAEQFCCIDDAKADPCSMGLRCGGACIHVSSFSGDAMAAGVVYLTSIRFVQESDG